MIVEAIFIFIGLTLVSSGLRAIAVAINNVRPFRFPKIQITEDPPNKPNSGSRWFVEQRF